MEPENGCYGSNTWDKKLFINGGYDTILPLHEYRRVIKRTDALWINAWMFANQLIMHNSFT
jgi:hypothetical protein